MPSLERTPMNKSSEDSKSKDKRLEEKEKLESEIERSLAVARMKQAHKTIEDVEKTRRRSAMISLCKRIDYLIAMIRSFNLRMLGQSYLNEITIGTPTAEEAQHYISTYESIRYDLKKSLDIKDEDMEKLFPKIEVRFGDRFSVIGRLTNINDQLHDMRLYCERMLL